MQPHSIRPPQSQPSEPGGFTLVHRPARGRRGLACWLAIPQRLPDDRPDDRPAVVAVHGIQRGAEEIARSFGPRAAAEGRVVIAPVFDEANWPGYQRLVRQSRADLGLIALLEELGYEGLAGSRRFTLFGFSGGAQFAHRFAMLYPHRVERLVAAAAGWYTMPDPDAAFPYGLGAERARGQAWGPRMATALPAFLQVPVTVLVGARDDEPDSATRSTPELDLQQGPDRLSRARRWTQAVIAAAHDRGLPARAHLEILDGCGHDFMACVREGGLVHHVFPRPEVHHEDRVPIAA